MIQEKLSMFDDARAITVTRNSTNVIDLLRAGQDIGMGEELFILVTVTTAFTAGGAATLHIAVVTDDNVGLTTPTVLQDQPVAMPVASLVAGFEIRMRINPSNIMQQYLGLVYTVATGPMTAGVVTASLQKDIQTWKAFPSNFYSP